MTRKDFIVLSFTLIGAGATAAACGSGTTNITPGDAGITGLGGRGGTGGAGGAAGAAGSGGAGGAAGAAGQAGTDAGTSACTNPLPESQVADALQHTHTVTVPASSLNATADQTFTTSVAAAPGGPSHSHMVTLTVAELGVLRGGGTVTVTSTISAGHLHAYTVSCH